MRTITQDKFNDILKSTDVKPRLRSELKFAKSIEGLPSDWTEYELIAISDRTNDKGILLLEPYEDLYIVQYELSRKIIDHKTGRRRAIICDFCYTWQPGSNAASIVFSLSNTKHKIGFLCCGDFKCSLHVRSMTKDSIISRTQLRENLSNEDRIARLKKRLSDKIEQLELSKVVDDRS